MAKPSTSSKFTITLGLLFLAWLTGMLFLALIYSPAHPEQQESVRLMYIHLPSIAVAYTAFFLTFIGSVLYLAKKSIFWDLVAASAAEIGVLFCTVLLFSGMLWGKKTWGIYWDWEDPQLLSTAVMYVVYIGYLGLRRMDLTAEAISLRSAIVGILGIGTVIVVHYAVKWWRSGHQDRTIDPEKLATGTTEGIFQINDRYLFTTVWAIATFMALGLWLLVHRFRVAWLERQLAEIDVEEAIELRRQESAAYIGSER